MDERRMEVSKVQVLSDSVQSVLAADPGEGPAWESDTLPQPPAFSPRNFLRMVVPGAILLAAAIGGGEWLMGPTAAVQYGTSIFGVATIAIILQIFFNLEAATPSTRVNLYTVELCDSAPGPAFWGPFYCVLALVNMGWSALAASCAATLFSVFRGRIPATGDEIAMYWLAILTVIVASGILAFGTTVERTLERASKVMVVLIFLFLFVANIIFVPWRNWLSTLVGFFQFNTQGQKVDWTLLGALAASSGAGGISCLSISNLVRDKGFGMGARVGAIPAALENR